jgi:hypothetical protein
MTGTLAGLDDVGGFLESGSSVEGMASGSPSKRGFNGLRAMFCSGNLMSGDRVLSGDNDSARMGTEVDMRWAFLSSPSPMRFLCVPPLLVVRVV